jgi:hypothetical protein
MERSTMKLRFTTFALLVLAVLAVPAAASASEGYAGNTINGHSVEYEGKVGSEGHVAFFVTLHGHRITTVTEFGVSMPAQCNVGEIRVGAGIEKTLKVSKSGVFSATGQAATLENVNLQMTVKAHFEDKGRKVAGTVTLSGTIGEATGCASGTVSFTAK